MKVLKILKNDFDASVINRNILNGNNMQKEFFSQMAKLPRIRLLSGLSYSAKKIKGRNIDNRNRNISFSDKKGNYFSYGGEDIKNMTLNLSFGGMKKIAKESGFGY